MTLIELTVAVAVMSLVVVVLGGIVTAVDTARRHVDGLHEAAALGRFAVGRIHDAVNRVGTYRVGGGETVPGIAVVRESDRPETLVLWTGGRESSLAAHSPLARLPKANELVIVTPDPAAPQRLVEIVVPTAPDDVDFRSGSFATRVRQLIRSPNAEKVLLCDRVRVAEAGGVVAAALRFEAEATPTQNAIDATTPGTAAWRGLPWVGGSSTNRAGLRQVALRIEIQVVTLGRPGETTGTTSLPVFGSAARRYLHRKG
jgi:hypothetical protein